MGRRCRKGFICLRSTSFVFFLLFLLFGICFMVNQFQRAKYISGAGKYPIVKFRKSRVQKITTPDIRDYRPVSCRNPPSSSPRIYYKSGDVMMDPYQPPLKDNKFYSKYVGIPINIPTSTVDSNFSAVGLLTRAIGKEMILPLLGRPLHFGRDKWQYYAMSDKNNNIKLPLSKNGKSCTGEYGCDSLSNGDVVYAEGYNDAFKVTIYENNVPRYIPFI